MLNALEAILYCTGLHSWNSFSYTLVITLLYHARCLHIESQEHTAPYIKLKCIAMQCIKSSAYINAV